MKEIRRGVGQEHEILKASRQRNRGSIGQKIEDVEQEIEDSGREVGQEINEVGREVGQEITEVGREIGQEINELEREVGRAGNRRGIRAGNSRS